MDEIDGSLGSDDVDHMTLHQSGILRVESTIQRCRPCFQRCRLHSYEADFLCHYLRFLLRLSGQKSREL